ncbi:MAG: molybdopterin molybdotransferase MoeA [Candidatus Tyrphobacter sp.]
MTRSFDEERLLPPAQALERFFAGVAIADPPEERVSLTQARARVLACEVDADAEYPSTRRSAMDGFAVAAASTPGRLRVTGDVRMGERFHGTVAAGEAVRIPTGGVIPQGADAVVPIESASVRNGTVCIEEPVIAGADVIERGSDMRAGERLLRKGRRIGAPELAVLATLGVASVPVFARPIVSVISSGDEIVEPQQPLRGGEVRDANRYALAAALESIGARVRHTPIVRDVEGALEDALKEALDEGDAAVVTGGSSVGERDYTPAAVASLGEPGVVVHGLRVRPGRPTLLAAAGGKPIVGLPGNPLSALMMFETIGAPIVAALCGTQIAYDEIEARLEAAIAPRAGWTWYVPVALSQRGAQPLPLHSFATSIAARASGYVVAERAFAAGERVAVRRFLCGGARP